MQADEPRSTSATLLGRLRHQGDEEAWQTFYRRYAPRITNWGRQKRLDEADVNDLTQEVLMRVLTLIRKEWVYDPGKNFSGLLRTLWQRAFCDWQRARTRVREKAVGGEGTDPLDALEAQDFVGSLREFLQREELDEALARLAVDYPHDILLLRAYLDGEKTGALAERLKEQKANVAVAQSRAKARLRKVLGELGSDLAVDVGENEGEGEP